jgi:hypothetical protein
MERRHSLTDSRFAPSSFAISASVTPAAAFSRM